MVDASGVSRVRVCVLDDESWRANGGNLSGPSLARTGQKSVCVCVYGWGGGAGVGVRASVENHSETHNAQDDHNIRTCGTGALLSCHGTQRQCGGVAALLSRQVLQGQDRGAAR